MNTPANLKYAKSDEWFDPDSGKIGITDYAQNQLSDIVFIEIFVDAGETIEAGKAIAAARRSPPNISARTRAKSGAAARAGG